MKKQLFYFLTMITLLLQGCGGASPPTPTTEADPTETTDPEETKMDELVIPENFNFATQGSVQLNISDNDEGATYTVYTYDNTEKETQMVTYIADDGEEYTDPMPTIDELTSIEIGSAIIVGGAATIQLTVATDVSQLILRKRMEDSYINETIDIENTRPTTYNFNGSSLKSRLIQSPQLKNVSALAKDVLWCVNGSGECFTVDPETLETTAKPNLTEGTWTVAMDYTNHQLYTIGRGKPYKLYRYDIDVEDNYSMSASTVIKELGFGGPRLEYANDEGFLYFSNKDYILKIDPATGNTLEQWDIDSGLTNTGGGDIAKGTDNNWYISTFGGLYSIEFTENSSIVKASRRSADALPFTPTSLAIDSKEVADLWVASNDTPSSLYVMDQNTGSMADRDPDNELAINDLTKTPISYEGVEIPDTDGDGCPDDIDEFPNDPEVCFQSITPTKYGWGSLAFEDLWPSKGDYDFNDLVVHYRNTTMLNQENKVVKMLCKFWICHEGGSFRNGFGFQMDNITPDQISEVTGTDVTLGNFTIDSNGLEAEQEKAVVIVIDDSQKYSTTTESNPMPTTATEGLNVLNVMVKFTNPIDPEELGSAPFNPFIVSNISSTDGGDRAREVHLPRYAATSLGSGTKDFGTDNADEDGNYVTDSGLPWAINIVHQFKFTKEKIQVIEGYNYFRTWCESGGTAKTDWYKDNSGYRNNSKLN